MPNSSSTQVVTVRLDDMIAKISDAHPDYLDRLSEAVLAADYLGDVADHLIGHFVDQARRSGASWTEIGKSMGVTKQAAQQRFVPRNSMDAPDAPFTARAWNVLTIAQTHARTAANDHIAPCHLILGLLGEPKSIAGSVLTTFGVKPADLKRRAQSEFPPPATSIPELMPCHASARKALDLAQRQALRLGHNYVGTEHILLGLIENEDGEGILSSVGLELAAVRADVRTKLGNIGAHGGAKSSG